MKIVVAGATGYIGRHLVGALVERGDDVVALTRDPESARSSLPGGVRALAWSIPDVGSSWAGEIDGADAVVNLAGEPVADKRWTAAQKEKILRSRVDATNSLVDAIAGATSKPAVLVNGSAMGYYGRRGDEGLTESAQPGDDFLAGVCVEWEQAASKASKSGVRVVMIRTGIVLGTDGGALPRMAMPFKLFGGGVMGPKGQIVSWIHEDDEIGIILLALDNQAVTGPVNSTAPNPVTMAEFSRSLGRALHRPVWVPGLPAVMGLVLGERTQVAFASQRVVPEKALQLGYRFRYPELGPALAAVFA